MSGFVRKNFVMVPLSWRGPNLSIADIYHNGTARTRFQKLKRHRMRCRYCSSYRKCSTRLKACFYCFYGALMELKEMT